MEVRYQGQPAIRIERSGEGYTVNIEERKFDVGIIRVEPTALIFTIDGKLQRVHLVDQGQTRLAAVDAVVHTLKREDTARQRHQMAASDASSLSASMPGQVIKVLVAAEDAVTAGQTLVVLEAMKMEIRITAPQDSRVQRIRCAEGDIVERGQILIDLQ